MASERKNRLQGVVTAVRILYHGFSIAGFRDDIKRVWTWLAAWAASVPLLLEPVREWFSHPATHQFLVARIGYVPVVYGAVLVAIALRKIYRRGLALNDPARKVDKPSRPALEQAGPSERELFLSWADDALTIAKYFDSPDQHAPHLAAEYEVRWYALLDRLSGLGVRFPTDVHSDAWSGRAFMLIGLMRNGNLEKAQSMFPLEQPVGEVG